MRLRPFLFASLILTAWLHGQENPDSLYRNILFKRERGDLSIIQVDKAITFENQRSPFNQGRVAELYLYRGELLQFEKRHEEAIEAYSLSLNHPAEQWILDAARFNRALVYDGLGSLRAGKRGEERLAASQLYWIGGNDGLETIPAEFHSAERDYRAVDSMEARERLLRLFLITGKIRDAAAAFRELGELRHEGDGQMRTRLPAYEILLSEADEDFGSADRIAAQLSPDARKRLEPVLSDIRANRLDQTVRFDWFDRTVHDADVSIFRTDISSEARPFSACDFRFVSKRLVAEGGEGGFLVSADAGAFLMSNGGLAGTGADIDVLGTFLNGAQSLPGGGFWMGRESFGGSGKIILKTGDGAVSEKSENRFGFSLHGGVRQKLFAYASYGRRDAWLGGLSDRLSASNAMWDSLGIPSPPKTKVSRTEGVYGMGSAGAGWWPGKTRAACSDLTVGFNTALSRHASIGASYSRLSSELTDHQELTLDDPGVTYSHRIFVAERLDLIRLNSEIRFAAAGMSFAAGCSHSFECAGRIRFNARSSQVVRSVPDAGGIHAVLLGDPDTRLGGAQLAGARDATGYLPSASAAYARVTLRNLHLSTEYRVNGLRAGNREVRFRIGFRPGRKTLTQCLHDLAPWR